MRRVAELERRDRVGRHRDKVDSLEEARDMAGSLEGVLDSLEAAWHQRGLRKVDNLEGVPGMAGKRVVAERVLARPVAPAPVPAPRPGSSESLPVFQQFAVDK